MALHLSSQEQRKQKSQPATFSSLEKQGAESLEMRGTARTGQRLSHTQIQLARFDPARLSSGDVQQIQRTVGNRAVAELLGRQQARPSIIQRQPNISALPTHAPGGTIQRVRFFDRFKRRNRKSTQSSEGSSSGSTVEDVPTEEDETVANRFMFTIAVKREDENFLTDSAKFTMGKFARKFGINVGPDAPPVNTGHAWVVLKTFHDDTELSVDSYGLGKRGFLHPDPYFRSSGDETFYKDHYISREAYNRVMDRLALIEEKVNKGEIKYEAFGYNCAAFVRDMTKTAGLPFPGSKVVPFIFTGKASAFTPNKLYKALNKQYNKGVPNVHHDMDGNSPDDNVDDDDMSWVAEMMANARNRNQGQSMPDVAM